MPLLRRLYAAQLATSLGDGAVLTTATLYFAVIAGFGEGVVGPALGAGALLGLLLSVPIGVVADRVGIGVTAAVLSTLSACAMLLFAFAQAPAMYVAGAICFGIAQASLMPLRQALAASHIPLDARVRMRAMLHTLVNIGMGLGAAWGAVAIAINQHAVFVGTFVTNAVICLATGALYLTLRSSTATAHLPGSQSAAWRNPRLIALTALSATLQFSMPILSVLLPIWVATRTAAPEWIAAAAFVMNTALVVATQLRWAAWVSTAARARASVLLAGSAAIVATALLGLAARSNAGAATALVLVGVFFITVTEVCAGAAAWYQLTRLSPVGRQGEFQAVYGTSTTFARIIGPAVLLPVVIAVGLPAWLVLGAVVMLAAILLSVALSRPTVKA